MWYICAPETLFLTVPSLWLTGEANVRQINIF